MTLVITTMGFFGTLSIIEALFGVEVSAFDFATTFGLIMMIGILAGTLTAGSRFVWAGAVALSVATWSITMGILRNDATEVMGVRAVIAVSGVILTTALASKLFDDLALSIDKFTNAIKYGGDRIILGIREQEGRAQLMVADDGVGVPILASDLIFERYYRSPQSQTLPGSVGIGLAVSRQLADLMDGTLQYVHGESTPRFELSLPLARTVDARPDATSEASTTTT
jgi:K+-sensing histidine kinase KdpD